MNRHFEPILDYINTLEIVDTHEHLPPRNEFRDSGCDIISEFLIHYFVRDLVSSGMSNDQLRKVTGGELSLREKWAILAPYWEWSRHTGYGQALAISARDLYGVENIDESTVEALDAAFREARRGDHYNTVLKQRSRIVTSLLDSGDWGYENGDRRYFTPVCRIDDLVYPTYGDNLISLEHRTGGKITCFEDYLGAVEKKIDLYHGWGLKTLKCGLAYSRTLHFERVTYSQAESEFNTIFRANFYIDRSSQVYTTGKAFQDYMMHYVLKLMGKRGMTLQVHTGLLEGNGNILANSDPRHLNHLFLEYPDVKFDLFHISFPFTGEAGTLCKMFPNVFIDMCWAHIISPPVCRRVLGDWLEEVPYNKISAFGGDYCFIDGVYGHQVMARRNVAHTLADKVEDGLFGVEQAMKIALALFRDNPRRIFGLEI